MSKKEYIYKGPILKFGVCIDAKWEAATMAVSPKQALNNLKFQAKQMLKLTNNARIELDMKYLKEV